MKVLRSLPARLMVVLLTAALMMPVAPSMALAKTKKPTVKAWMLDKRPAQYTDATVYARFKDKKGKPAKNVKVTFTWVYKTASHKVTARTNKYGVAQSTRWISGATIGRKVVIKVRAKVGGRTLNTSTYFIPK